MVSRIALALFTGYPLAIGMSLVLWTLIISAVRWAW
jgi:hypothetical protein